MVDQKVYQLLWLILYGWWYLAPQPSSTPETWWKWFVIVLDNVGVVRNVARMPKLQHLGLLTNLHQAPFWSVAMKKSSKLAMATEATWNSMKTSTSMSAIFSSTLNPLELEEIKMLNKIEKLEDLTIFGFVWGIVHKGSMLKPKNKLRELFPSSLNYSRE